MLILYATFNYYVRKGIAQKNKGIYRKEHYPRKNFEIQKKIEKSKNIFKFFQNFIKIEVG